MKRFLHETNVLFKLAGPILLGQVAQTMMGLTDTIMAGRVSATDLAAVSVGGGLWFPALLTAIGLLMALPPTLSKHHGAGDSHQIAPTMQQGIWLSLPIMALVVIYLLAAPLILSRMDLEPALLTKAQGYLQALAWGGPAFVLFAVFRNTSEGTSHTKPPMVIGFLGFLVNIPLNYALIYGKFGLPALGGVGCGYATATVAWTMAISMGLYLRWSERFEPFDLFQRWHKPDLARLKQLVGLGLPISLSLLFEVSLFSVAALLLAPLGSVTVAGHQIAMNFGGLIFMIPLSIGMAVTIRIGFNLGRGERDTARLSSYTALITGLCIGLITAVGTIVWRQPIAELFSVDPEVIAMASHLLLFAAAFQLSDVVQVIVIGALRGYKDTVATSVITLAAYWGVGLPTGVILGLTDLAGPAMGAPGLWIGFIVGLSSAAVMLGIRLVHIQKRVDTYKGHGEPLIAVNG